MMLVFTLALSLMGMSLNSDVGHPSPDSSKLPYPPSPVITGLTFYDDTMRTMAPGSDIWPLTWGEDGHQYTSWGDGGGFGGTNTDGRVSLGFGRVEGSKEDYRGRNIWGGKDAENPAEFGGKCCGILAIGDILYAWRDGDASNASAFKSSRLYRSATKGASWEFADVEFKEDFFAPTFCQFGRGYRGSHDKYVYIYAPEKKQGIWDVMEVPGEITLIRVHKDRLADRSAYRFFSGLSSDGRPTWSASVSERVPVFRDPINGVHRMAVSYNPGLHRYFLTTMTVSRDGWIGVYDSSEPWGPWTTTHFGRNVERWGSKTICYTFSNKWLSPDGKRFVMVYTRNDSWASIEGAFDTRDQKTH